MLLSFFELFFDSFGVLLKAKGLSADPLKVKIVKALKNLFVMKLNLNPIYKAVLLQKNFNAALSQESKASRARLRRAELDLFSHHSSGNGRPL